MRQLIKHTESGNIRIRKLNEFRNLRRLTGPIEDNVSSDEEEEPIPSISSFLTSINPSVLELAPTAAHTSAIHRDDQEPLGIPVSVEPTANPELRNNWRAMIANTNGIQNPLPKDDYLDFSEAAPVFKASEALKNIHELDPTAIPVGLKQMAHYRVFIPLSMFTTDALKRIRDNVGDLYTKKKTGLSAGKYILNSDLFPSEDTLTEQTFFQAYRNWLKMLSSISEPAVASGWHHHHEKMMGDANFSSSFQAWKSHDRDLRTSFFNAPYILDVNSGAYIKGFDRAWMTSEVNSFRKERSNPPSEHRSSRNSGSSRPSASSNNNNRFAPYDRHSDSFLDSKRPTLCLRCGDTGHRANQCNAAKPSKPSRTFVSEWKDDRLITIKTRKHLCVLYNVRGFCNDEAKPRHAEHACSLCTDPKHGATNCTRN